MSVHTLFESHLSYGITVWGGVAQNRLRPLFITQKHCIRIMFGDTAAYLDKFNTCVRSRPFESQVLGSDFYIKEHSKPLFNKNEIFTVQNLYQYHTILNTFKIIKNHTPVALYSCFTLSRRKTGLLITPNHSHNFIYKATSLWNMFNTTVPFHESLDFTAGIGYVKGKIRSLIYKRQKLGDQHEWNDDNFSLL